MFECGGPESFMNTDSVMINTKKTVAVYTALKPTTENKNSPGFLIQFYIEALKKEYNVQVINVEAKSIPAKLGVYFKGCSLVQADAYVVYPFHLFFKFNWNNAKVLVIGPDSPSLLFKRIALISSGMNYFKSFLLCRYFGFLERHLTSISRLIVVGMEDKNNVRLNSSSEFICNSKYIPHPFNEYYISDRNRIERPKRRLIFSGDLSSKYVGSLDDSIQLINYFNNNQILEEVLFVGRSSTYIYEKLSSDTNLSSKIKYIEWIENYSEISMPGRDIHVAPLSAGAGTKNRVLASISLGVPVIGTRIAFENIDLLYPSIAYLGLFYFSEVSASLHKILAYNAPSDLDQKIQLFNEKVSQEFLRCLKDVAPWN